MLYLQTNPGKVLISGLTSGEVSFVSDLYTLPYVTGDILYYDGTKLNRLGIGSNGDALKVIAGLPSWNPSPSNVAYTYTKAVAAVKWEILHNLDSSAPVISVYNDSGYAIEPESIIIIDKDNIEINFGEAVAGKAVIVVVGGTGGGGSGTVTSVAMSVPTGLSISGSPITSSGTFALSLTAGYVIPTQATLDAKLINITGFITAGSNVTITGAGTAISPYIINAAPGTGGQVDSVVGGTGIDVDSSDPENPVTSLNSASIASLAKADTAIQNLAGLSITTTATKINFLSNVTSDIQAQINAKSSVTFGTVYQIPFMNAAGTDFEYGGISALNNSGLKFQRYVDSIFNATLKFEKYRGTSGTPTAVSNGDIILNLEGHAYTGSSLKFLSVLRGTVLNNTDGSEETDFSISLAKAGVISGRHHFRADGSICLGSISTERGSRIMNSGEFEFNSDESYIRGRLYTNFNGSSHKLIEQSVTGSFARLNLFSIFGNTVDASVPTTYTDAASLYIGGTPVEGTNVTMTQKWSLYALGTSFINKLITNLPSGSYDATPKIYVDEKILKTNTSTSTATLTPSNATATNYYLTAQAVALDIANPTMNKGEKMVIYIYDSGTARAITFGTDYKAFVGNPLPTTTTVGKWTQIIIDKVDTNVVFVSSTVQA